MNDVISIFGKNYSGDELVSAKVVAEIIGLSYRTVQDMCSRRELPMYKVAKRAIRFKVSEIVDWVEDRKIE